MLTQVKNAKLYLEAKLGLSQRGAEMVEYAIVLACVAAVGVAYYSSAGNGTTSLKGAVENLWGIISGKLSSFS